MGRNERREVQRTGKGFAMKTDRELLELAAKAAGLEIAKANQAERDALVGREAAGLWLSNGKTWWNPLKDDCDALRLAVTLELNVFHSFGSAYAMEADSDGSLEVGVSYFDAGDKFLATRRAIVKVAAEIGEAMP